MSECELRYRNLQVPLPQWEDPPRDGPGRAPRRQLGIQMVFEYGDVPVQGIWPGCFPRGNLSLITGYPGVGKSFVALDIAARLTIGRDWPDGTPAPRTGNPTFKDREHFNRAERRAGVLVSGDDALHSTIAKRFQGAGGDLERLWNRMEPSCRTPDSERSRVEKNADSLAMDGHVMTEVPLVMNSADSVHALPHWQCMELNAGNA